MKRAFWIAALLAVAAFCGAQPKTANLQYKFHLGDVDRYKVTTVTTMVMPGMQSQPPMTSGFVMRQKVIEVYRNGSAKIKTSVENVLMKSPNGPFQPAALPDKPIVMTMIMGKDGKVSSITGLKQAASAGIPGMDPSQLMTQTGAASLPGKTVAVGKSWTQLMPMPAGGGTLKVRSTLASCATPVDGQTAAKIAQKYSASLSIAQMMKSVMGSNAGGPTGTVNLTGSGNAYFSQKLGRIIRTDVKMKSLITTNMPPQRGSKGKPSTMHMTMNTKVSMVRIK